MPVLLPTSVLVERTRIDAERVQYTAWEFLSDHQDKAEVMKWEHFYHMGRIGSRPLPKDLAGNSDSYEARSWLAGQNVRAYMAIRKEYPHLVRDDDAEMKNGRIVAVERV